MSDSSPKTCRRIVFHGRVQGVGFRMTTKRLSRKYDVVGYVKNLSDGTVELLVRANEAEIERFLNAIRQQFSGNIESEDAAACDDSMRNALAKNRTFTVRY